MPPPLTAEERGVPEGARGVRAPTARPAATAAATSTVASKTSSRTASSGGGSAGPVTSSTGGSSTGSARSAKPKEQQSPHPPDSSGGATRPTPGCIEFVTIDAEKSDFRKGTAVHTAIAEQVAAVMKSQYGPRVSVYLTDASYAPYKERGSVEYGGKKTGGGYVDLAFRSPYSKTLLLAEIKPANLKALYAGEEQLKDYIDKANQSDEAKAAYGVTSFSLMLPDRFELPPVVSKGRWFEIRWCVPGVIVYKELRKKRDQDDEQGQKSESQRARTQRQASPDQRATAPALDLQKWTPEQLRRDIEAGMLEDGVYRDRYKLAWPTGDRTNLVVWVKTGAGAREIQYYQELPETREFYEKFAQRRGLSDRQADLIRRTMIDYNRDLYELIVDPNTKRMTGRSPDYARAELRTIYIDRLRGVVRESATTMVVSGAVSAVSNAMQGLTTIGRSIGQEARSIPVRETRSIPVREAPPVPAREATLPPGSSPVADIPAELLNQVPRASEAIR